MNVIYSCFMFITYQPGPQFRPSAASQFTACDFRLAGTNADWIAAEMLPAPRLASDDRQRGHPALHRFKSTSGQLAPRLSLYPP